jgi:hypothetical protein
MANPHVQDFWFIHVLKVAGDGEPGDLLGKIPCHIGSDDDKEEHCVSVRENFERVLGAGRYKVVGVDPDLDAVMNAKQIYNIFYLLPLKEMDGDAMWARLDHAGKPWLATMRVQPVAATGAAQAGRLRGKNFQLSPEDRAVRLRRAALPEPVAVNAR